MTNLEYAAKNYPNVLIDLIVNRDEKLAVDTSSDDGKYKVCKCSDIISCADCKFNCSYSMCEDLAVDWLREEYKEINNTSDNDEGGISW